MKIICFPLRQQGVSSQLSFANRFDGDSYVPRLDHDRLSSQLTAVRDFMLRSGQWWTLSEIQQHTSRFDKDGQLEQFSEAGISARLRDLRKERFGSYQVERRRRSQSLFEYRVMSNATH